MTNLRQRACRGTTIFELITYIGLLSVLLTSSLILFRSVIDLRRHIAEEVDQEALLWRLAESWRNDVHRAEQLQVADDQQSVLLVLNNQARVRYRRSDDMIVRESEIDAPQRDVFRIPPGATVRFSAAGRLARVHLTDAAEPRRGAHWLQRMPVTLLASLPEEGRQP